MHTEGTEGHAPLPKLYIQFCSFVFSLSFSGFNSTCIYAFRWTCTSEMTPLVTKDLCLIGQKASRL